MTTQTIQNNRLGLLLVAGGMLCVSFTPVAAKLAYLGDANPLAVMTARCVLGMAGLGLFCLFWGIPLRIRDAAFRFGAVTGLAQVGASAGVLAAIAYIDVSLAILIVFIHPLLIAILNHLRGAARLNLLQFLCILSALLGLALALAVDFSTLDPFGLALAFLGMLGATVMVLAVFKAGRTVGSIPANFHMTVWASAIFLVAAVSGPALHLYDGPAFPGTATGWLGLAATGVSFTLGYVLFFSGAAVIGPTRASILSIGEPLMTILFAIALVGEHLSWLQWIGVACVVVSLGAIETLAKRQARD